MVNYIFPIFCFGLLITGVVIKGLLMASEMNRSQTRHGEGAEKEKPLSRQLLSILTEPQDRHSPDLVSRQEPYNPPS
ncbi:MAG: hypothetical protein ACM3KL_01585 [Alphaproteobacteria bacterium]|jgi:hypothetical protein